jgi:hypothetical protein
MNKKNTVLYILLLLLPFTFHASARRAMEGVYYYMKIDTSGIDVGYLRIDSTVHSILTVDDAKGDYALWRFAVYRNSSGTPEPNHYWIINYKSGDTLKFNAPLSGIGDALIDAGGNLSRWEQLFLDDLSGVDTLVASYLNLETMIPKSYFLTLHRITGKVTLLDKDSPMHPHIRFRIERGARKPDESAFYRLKVDTLDAPATALPMYLATDSVANTDSLRVDSVKSDYAAWRFVTDTIIDDTACYHIYNKATGDRLAFDVPLQDTVAVRTDMGTLDLWFMPFFPEDDGQWKLMLRDTVTRREYYLGLKDSTVMLTGDTLGIRALIFALEDEVLPPVDVPPAVEPFDSTQVYKVKMLSGPYTGKYFAATPMSRVMYIDSVYAHVPDGQFVVNRSNTHGLQNRSAATFVTDTFRFVIDRNTGDTIPDVYALSGDTVEALPVDYGSFDKQDSLLGYKYFPTSDLGKDSCFYLVYSSADSLYGRLLGYDVEGDTVFLFSPGDTAHYFIEYAGVEYGTEAPAEIATLRRHLYRLRSQEDTTRYFASNTPSELTSNLSNAGHFLFKEDGAMQGAYSLVFVNSGYSMGFSVDSVSKRLKLFLLTDSVPGLFRFVKTEIPVYPDDAYSYLRYLPDGKRLYEVHSTGIPLLEGKMLTRNFYHYAIFGKEGESILKAGSYTPSDFSLWLDTARGPGSNRFRTSLYIVREATDTTGFNMQGYFMHVHDSIRFTSADYYVDVEGTKYSRVNFVRARRTAANRLRLLDESSSAGEAGDDARAAEINEYRFYLQQTEETDVYYIVTEKGYGGRKDSTGYLSCTVDNKLYMGERADERKVHVRLTKPNGLPVMNEVVLPPAVPEGNIPGKVMITGGTGRMTIQNATGRRVQVYNIVGQLLVDKIASSNDEHITAPSGIAIVKVGSSITKKVIIR